MNVRMMIPGIALYLMLAVAFIWLGVGSIRARRWAWTLTVVLSWMWLIMGVAGFVGFRAFRGADDVGIDRNSRRRCRRRRLW